MSSSRTVLRQSIFIVIGLSSFAQAATLKIASVSPLSGDLSPIGVELRRGVELAVEARARAFKSQGHDLLLVPFDDQASASRAGRIARDIVADPAIVGVVGAVNSSVSNVIAQTFEGAQLAAVSPSSTDDTLTTHGWKSFSRLVAPDRAQAIAAATYLQEEASAKNVYIVSDNTAYGNGLSTSVQDQLKRRNITVSGYVGISDAAALAGAVKRIVDSRPDTVYFGGSDDTGAELIRALRTAGVTALFMGGNGLDAPSFAKRAGSAAAGVVYSTVYGPVSAYSGAEVFEKQYMARYKAAPTGRALMAYDAANVLLSAINAALKSPAVLPTRADVSEAVRKVKFEACVNKSALLCESISGPVAFDSRGERLRTRVMLMRLGSDAKANILSTKTIAAESLR